MDNKTSLFHLSDQSLWLRGKTPENIREQCYQLCREYLAGIWLRVSIDQIVVNRISGGLTNQLYYCAIEESSRTTGAKEPQEVAIRLYGDKHFNNSETNERLSDIIIAILVSENSLGAKIYGIFDRGQILDYHKVTIDANLNLKFSTAQK